MLVLVLVMVFKTGLTCRWLKCRGWSNRRRASINDARVTVFDWQTVSRGPAALDVAYFISGNLTEGVAAECEDGLLREYHQQLCDGGVRGYDFDTFLRDYRTALLYIGYRMIAAADMMDFSNERGTELMRGWLLRIDARLKDDFRELVGQPSS